MRKIKFLCVCGLFVLSACAFGTVLLEANATIETAETSKMVKLELKEDSESSQIIDDEPIVQNVMLTNHGIDAWIRIKRTLLREETNESGINFVDGTSLNFIEKPDGYIYFTEPLDSGETVCWQELIRIPQGETCESNAELDSTLVAEAVQKDFFEPNFTEEIPWKDVRPEASILEKGE